MSDLSPNVLTDITDIQFRTSSSTYNISSSKNTTVTYNIGNNSTSVGSTKTINIGTDSSNDSTTIINLGSSFFNDTAGSRTQIYLGPPAQPDNDSRIYFGVPENYSPNMTDETNFPGAGFQLAGSGSALFISRDGGFNLLRLNHTSDSTNPNFPSEYGSYISFKRSSVEVGGISRVGDNVSYSPFLGSHWGRFENNEKSNIPIGTILETIDKLIVWKIYKINVGNEVIVCPYNGTLEVGQEIEIEYKGSTYTSKIEYEEELELNKHVCIKVNDTVASSKVFGVFYGWDDKPISENVELTWNDVLCASVGNYFIRMAPGQDPQIGDLIEADGNGCGVVQDDDIVRSKTVAKVTSTIKQKFYDDGSFLVTCVLMCG